MIPNIVLLHDYHTTKKFQVITFLSLVMHFMIL
jgi:hypothetical protein